MYYCLDTKLYKSCPERDRNKCPSKKDTTDPLYKFYMEEYKACKLLAELHPMDTSLKYTIRHSYFHLQLYSDNDTLNLYCKSDN